MSRNAFRVAKGSVFTGIWSDEFLNVQYITISRILRPRTRPEWPLCVCSPSAAALEAIAIEDFTKAPVNSFRIRDGDLPT